MIFDGERSSRGDKIGEIYLETPERDPSRKSSGIQSINFSDSI